MKHIYIARHGLTDWNLVPKVQGMTNIPLNEKGINQAYELAEKISKLNFKFDSILCSPLDRARKTAEILGEENGIPVTVEPRLIEQNFGVWEGFDCSTGDRSFHEAKKQFADSYKCGESMMKLAQRVYNLLDELKNSESNKNILLVTHGGIARIVHSYFYDMTNEDFASFGLGNCELKEYKF